MTPDFSAKVHYLWDTIGDRRIIAIVGHATSTETVRGWMNGEPCEQQERVEILYDFARRIMANPKEDGREALGIFLMQAPFGYLAGSLVNTNKVLCAAMHIRNASPEDARRACDRVADEFDKLGWWHPALEQGCA